MYLGAHVSIAGGFEKSLDRIVDMGGNTLMTFASSPRQLSDAKVNPKSIELYKTKKNELKIGPHFFHGIYLVNLAHENKGYVKKSVESLGSYQKLAGEIGGMGTIFHLGSHKGQGLPKVIDQVVRAINEILDNTPKGITLYLENAAGQAGTIGSRLEELQEIIMRLGDKSKIGICLDTQHAFAAGYKLETLLGEFDRIINLKYLKVVHLNDSKTEFGSRVDRHENLGQGKIGLEALKNFVNQPKLVNIPIILEVPGEGAGPRKQDIDKLKALILK